eukprot:6019969-Pyramimonas_sp.AAC.1
MARGVRDQDPDPNPLKCRILTSLNTALLPQHSSAQPSCLLGASFLTEPECQGPAVVCLSKVGLDTDQSAAGSA